MDDGYLARLAKICCFVATFLFYNRFSFCFFFHFRALMGQDSLVCSCLSVISFTKIFLDSVKAFSCLIYFVVVFLVVGSWNKKFKEFYFIYLFLVVFFIIMVLMLMIIFLLVRKSLIRLALMVGNFLRFFVWTVKRGVP